MPDSAPLPQCHNLAQHRAECRIAIGIPVRNEEALIEDCLLSLAAQDIRENYEVAILLNNCTDDTAGVIERLSPLLPFQVHAPRVWLEPSRANAGTARREAVTHAAAIAGPNGIVLTTDADSVVPRDWLSSIVKHIDSGIDAVAGMVRIDEVDASRLPRRLVADEDAADAFSTMLDEIEWHLDPTEHDPWPRHTQHSGANFAVAVPLLHRAGGIPAVPLGEDRQFFAALRRVDARIRHSTEAVVTVSGRTLGRAAGGMADTIARRLVTPDEWLDDCIEPVRHRARRAWLRAAARVTWRTGNGAEELAADLHVDSEALSRVLGHSYFGTAWSELESMSPLLQYRKVRQIELEWETKVAARILERVRPPQRVTVTARQSDIGGVAS